MPSIGLAGIEGASAYNRSKRLAAQTQRDIAETEEFIAGRKDRETQRRLGIQKAKQDIRLSEQQLRNAEQSMKEAQHRYTRLQYEFQELQDNRNIRDEEKQVRLRQLKQNLENAEQDLLNKKQAYQFAKDDQARAGRAEQRAIKAAEAAEARAARDRKEVLAGAYDKAYESIIDTIKAEKGYTRVEPEEGSGEAAYYEDRNGNRWTDEDEVAVRDEAMGSMNILQRSVAETGVLPSKTAALQAHRQYKIQRAQAKAQTEKKIADAISGVDPLGIMGQSAQAAQGRPTVAQVEAARKRGAEFRSQVESVINPADPTAKFGPVGGIPKVEPVQPRSPAISSIQGYFNQ